MGKYKMVMDTCSLCGQQKMCNPVIFQAKGRDDKGPVIMQVPESWTAENEAASTRARQIGFRLCTCDACAEARGEAPKALWITWAVCWALLIGGMLMMNTGGGTPGGPGIALASVGGLVLLFVTCFLLAKSNLNVLWLMLLAVLSCSPVAIVVLMLLRKDIDHNNRIVTALKPMGLKLIADWDGTMPARRGAVTLPESAVPCAWADGQEQMLTAIQKTWGVTVTPYRISEQDARMLERACPMARDVRAEQAQYAVEQGSNSVCWHPYGAWVDFKHAKFLYKGNLYYVNVCPTVQLTQPMYDRTGDLNNMAKIMVCLGKSAGADRDRLVLALEGELHDQT